ncbi:hypothetical protein PT974_07891 [Cladobotryum mycophilum]|uniref:Rhodopsin domain-containing protein n=1 Tax=Cladobotryum mycophilum TaxID=491253 RepID=A0ABR0SBT9_9HYPO
MDRHSPWLRRDGSVVAGYTVKDEFPLSLALEPGSSLYLWRISPFLVEDILCYISLFFFWGVGINYVCMVVVGGAGYHIAHLQELHVARFSQITFAAQVLYALTLGFTKISIIWMIKRIFFTQSYAYVAYTIMFLNVVWMLQTVLTGVLICQPVTMNWDPVARARGHCGNQTLAFAAVSIVDIITDLAILILPMKMLLELQMKLSYKIALGCVFGAGFIIRLYYVFGLDFNDLTYSSVPLSIICTAQLSVAIMVSSAALLRPVFDRTIGSWLSLSLGSRHTKQLDSTSGAIRSTNSGTGFRSLTNRSKTNGSTFQTISESEENLRWEMDVMHIDKGRTLTSVSRYESGTDSAGGYQEPPPVGQIMITHEMRISRQ